MSPAELGGIVLAGGRSTRMGSPKADLEWHGSTLVYRVAGLVARSVDGPVVVVRAPGQELARLPPGTETTEDAVPGRGPLQGIAAGLAVLDERAGAAFVVAVDMPLIHPDFIRAVHAGLGDHDVAVPVCDDHRQPLAAVYRLGLRAVVEEIAAGESRGTGRLFARCRIREITTLPHPESLTGVNDPEAYAAARALPAPKVTLDGEPRRAATLQAAGCTTDVRLNGELTPYDPDLPLAEDDVLQSGHAGRGRPGLRD